MKAKAVPAIEAMHHVALYARAQAFEQSVDFYHKLLGMPIVWQPDADNVYLSYGKDNLALHRLSRWHVLVRLAWLAPQRLDHIGFRLSSASAVDAWHKKLRAAGVSIIAKPRTHRDHTRSFYCLDPGGTHVQLIYHPD